MTPPEQGGGPSWGKVLCEVCGKPLADHTAEMAWACIAMEDDA